MTKAAAEGGVKDESKETREKVFTQKRLILKVLTSFYQVQVMSLIAEELNTDSRDCKYTFYLYQRLIPTIDKNQIW